MAMLSCLNKVASIIKTDITGSLVAVAKPAGVLSHPNSRLMKQPRDAVTLFDGPPFSHYSMNEEAFFFTDKTKIFLCNRLDSATSGIILLATNKETADAVKRAFRSRLVSKRYAALVFNSSSPPQQLRQEVGRKDNRMIWNDPIETKKINENKLRTRAADDSKPPFSGTSSQLAMTESELRSSVPDKGISTLSLWPKTGYTHQLRYQCALHGFPIVGDKIYGDFVKNRTIFKDMRQYGLNSPRLFLHSEKIELSFHIGDNTVNFSAFCAPPNEFNLMMGTTS